MAMRSAGPTHRIGHLTNPEKGRSRVALGSAGIGRKVVLSDLGKISASDGLTFYLSDGARMGKKDPRLVRRCLGVFGIPPMTWR